MTKSEYEVKYRAPFYDANHALGEVTKSLYLGDIDATEVHIDTTPEEKKRRRIAAVKAEHPAGKARGVELTDAA